MYKVAVLTVDYGEWFIRECNAVHESIQSQIKERVSFEYFFGSTVNISTFEQKMEEIISRNEFGLLITYGRTASRVAIQYITKTNAKLPLAFSGTGNPVRFNLLRSMNSPYNKAVSVSINRIQNLIELEAIFLANPDAKNILYCYEKDAVSKKQLDRIRSTYPENSSSLSVRLFPHSRDISENELILLEKNIQKVDFVCTASYSASYEASLKTEKVCVEHNTPLFYSDRSPDSEVSLLGVTRNIPKNQHLRDVFALMCELMLKYNRKPGEIKSFILRSYRYLYINEPVARKFGLPCFPEFQEYLKFSSLWGARSTKFEQLRSLLAAYMRGEKQEECVETFRRETERIKKKFEDRWEHEQEECRREIAMLEELKKPKSFKIAIVRQGAGIAHDALTEQFKRRLQEICPQDLSITYVEHQAIDGDYHEYLSIAKQVQEEECDALFTHGFNPSFQMKHQNIEQHLHLPIVFGGVSHDSLKKLIKRKSGSHNRLVGVFIRQHKNLLMAQEVLHALQPRHKKILIIGTHDLMHGTTLYHAQRLKMFFEENHTDACVTLHIAHEATDHTLLHKLISKHDVLILPEGGVSRDTASLLTQAATAVGIPAYGGSSRTNTCVTSDCGTLLDFEFCGYEAAELMAQCLIEGKNPRDLTSKVSDAALSFSGNYEQTLRPLGVSMSRAIVILDGSLRSISLVSDSDQD